MANHKWEYEIGEGYEKGTASVCLEDGETSWSYTGPKYGLLEGNELVEQDLFAREILRLAKENARLTEVSRVMLKAFSILAHEMWICFKEDMDLDSDAIREALEAAGLIEMLADQTWSLTELGGRVCRREP